MAVQMQAGLKARNVSRESRSLHRYSWWYVVILRWSALMHVMFGETEQSHCRTLNPDALSEKGIFPSKRSRPLTASRLSDDQP